MFRITKDHTGDPLGTGETRIGYEIRQMPLYAVERMMGEDDAIPNEGPTIAFKLCDDDGEVMYEGVLTDDDECVNQSAALRWGEADAGCTNIQVQRDGIWRYEIA